MDRTLNQLMRELSEIATAHRQIKEYFQGDFLDAVSRDAAQYPLMVATLQPGGLGDGFVQVNIIITIADKYNLQEYRQINEIHSDCLSICNDIKITMQQYRWTEFSDINFTISTDPFIQRSQDMTAGWSMNVSLNVFDDGNWCDLPMDNYDFENGTPTFSGDCQPALVVNSDESFSRSIPSGDSYTLDDVHIVVTDQSENVLSDSYYPAAQDEVIVVTVPPCADASYRITTEADVTLYEGTIESGGNLVQPINDSLVHNTNDTYLVNLPAEGNLELPDVTFSVENSLEVVVASATVPSVNDSILTAPDGVVHIKHEADGTIANVNTPSGATTEYIIQNNDITVNGANGFVIHAEEPLDILLQNQSGGTIAAQSVTYNGNQDHVNIVINTASFAPVGISVQKSAQTISYRTGDDGDIEAGRATSFTVLASNNPFGNSNRFTDTLGGQTYANNIVIDWSTYNGTNVLGYKRTLRTPGINWNNAIDESIALSFGGFTTGWRMANVKEIQNIYNYGVNYTTPLNYSPFNLSTNTLLLWCSTTPNGQTTDAFYFTNNGGMSFVVKTFATNITYISCRTFTVTGTTLS